MNGDIFLRYVLDFAMLYPGAALCYLPVQNHLRLPRRKLAALVLAGVTAVVLGCSLICTLLHLYSTRLILPVFALSFLVFRRTLSDKLPVGKAAYAFATMTTMMGACVMLTNLLTAAQELKNPDYAALPATSLICLGLSLLAVVLYALLIRRRDLWLIDEFHVSRIWRLAWLLPICFTAIYVLMVPKDLSTILVNRVQRMGVLLVIASVLVYQVLVFLFYRIAKGLTDNARLARENQLLTIEAHRYKELRAHMEETRLLRHDFRQHLRVVAQLTDAGQTEELRQYLSQYDQELGGEHVALCENAAVDAIAGYYSHYAASHDIPIHWNLTLPETLSLPETDICMLLGNLLENSLRASLSLPEERRDVRVICRMLSPAMLGLIVENTYNGMLKKEGNAFLSTHHEGVGFGLQSVENTVRRYRGKLTIETESQVFSVNILLNL